MGDRVEEDLDRLLAAKGGEVGSEVHPRLADLVAGVADRDGGLALRLVATQLHELGGRRHGRGAGQDRRHLDSGDGDFVRIIEAARLHRLVDAVALPEIALAVHQPPLGEVLHREILGIGEFDHVTDGLGTFHKGEGREHALALVLGER